MYCDLPLKYWWIANCQAFESVKYDWLQNLKVGKCANHFRSCGVNLQVLGMQTDLAFCKTVGHMTTVRNDQLVHVIFSLHFYTCGCIPYWIHAYFHTHMKPVVNSLVTFVSFLTCSLYYVSWIQLPEYFTVFHYCANIKFSMLVERWLHWLTLQTRFQTAFW